MKPLVSILIPAFNAEEWVGDTIQSALAQTWPRKEIIVVDDGSKDRTLSVARQCANEQVRVVTQPNQGAAAARNKAYSISQGDYIQWLDADDLLAPDKIAKQVEILNKCASNRTLLSSAWGQFMYRLSRAKFTPTPLWSDLSPVEWLVRKMGQNIFMQTATWLVSRELTQAAGPWDTRLWVDDDGEYFCRVILKSDGVRFVPGAKVFYRRPVSENLSFIGQSDEKMKALLLSIRMHIGYLRSLEDSPRVRTACLIYLQGVLPFFYPEKLDLVAESEQLAADLGGKLEIPRLSWKYAWIQKVFGWSAAKRAQLGYNKLKGSMMRSWDKALFHLEQKQMRELV